MSLPASSCVDSLVLKRIARVRVILKPRRKSPANGSSVSRTPPATLPRAIPASAPLDSEEDIAFVVAGDVVGVPVRVAEDITARSLD
jgi:hypothetical protein